MKKRNFFTGSIFQFFVPEINKYAFCKYYDFTALSSFHGLLAQVFNHFSDSAENNLDQLKFSAPLFGHRSMDSWPKLTKDTRWKSLGILSGVDDEKVPDFKGVQVLNDLVADESSIGPWYPVHRLTQRGANCEYKDVAHLERKILTTHSLCLPRRTGMEYCRQNNLPIGKYYDLSNRANLIMYWQMINTPIYSTTPIALRGKAKL